MSEHFRSAEEQQHAEYVQDPFESADDGDAEKYEKESQYDSPDYAPAQDSVLGMFGDAEAHEDHQENKDIIYGQRQFHEITAQEFNRLHLTEQEIYAHIEAYGQSYPEQQPFDGFHRFSEFMVMIVRSIFVFFYQITVFQLITCLSSAPCSLLICSAV